MKNAKLSGRYAKALHQFAIEQNVEETVYQDILFLSKVFKENTELRVAIESPVIVASKKEAIFKELFQDKINAVTLGFLNLIIVKRREPSLTDIFEQFVKCYYEKHHIRSAVVTTAMELNPELAGKIKKILEEQTHSTIILKQVVNPKLIGGFVVRVDDFLFDASLLGRINRLKAEFSHNLYQAGF